MGELRVKLLVTREYEHLVVAIGTDPTGSPSVSFFPIPHPSGIAVHRSIVHIASTRNPNQLFDFGPVEGDAPALGGPFLVPLRSRVFPGRLYLHELSMIGDVLYGNAVGMNSVVSFTDRDYRLEWWPRCAERRGKVDVAHNYIQLNSIAAGASLKESYFSASTDRMSSRRPGHLNFPVDKRGVVFFGRTREPVLRGLTRPHSARLHQRKLWVNNSGYGEVGFARDDRFESIARLPGWTRGLSFKGRVAFVGLSRVIPRFRSYAPGVATRSSVCGISAVDTRTGRILGGMVWPRGNQIFAVEAVSDRTCAEFPFRVPAERNSDRRELFYSFHHRKEARKTR